MAACADGDDDDDDSGDYDDASADDTAGNGDDDTGDDADDDAPPVKARIAVISDLHLWYPETEMGDETMMPNYPALYAHEPLEYIRNEGPVISRAAILDAVGKGATHIVLNGDFGDSAERAVYDAFVQDLDGYEQQYGVDFFFVRGNHDSITNENHETGEENSSPLFDGMVLDNSRTYSIGAAELFDKVRSFGLSNDGDGPPIDYLYWERGPATENGCGTTDEGEDCATQTQFSYLVEPVENLWLLIIDTNGFTVDGGDSGWSSDGLKMSKPRTWAWIGDVFARAAEQNKTVIAFGHHNLGDPFCGLTFDKLGFLEGLLFDTRQSAEELAGMGMKIYVSGHLHMDYVSDFTGSEFSLIDVQTPSLANYPVGYRLFTFYEDETVDVETVAVRDVPDWDRYIGDYRAFAAENDYPFEQFDIQNSATFSGFVDRTFENMITVKIVGAVGDWAVPLLKSIRLYDLLLLTGLQKSVESVAIEGGELRYAANADFVKDARNDLDDRISGAGLSVEEFKSLSIYDLAFATVRIQFGAKNAIDSMEQDGRLDYYRFFLNFMNGRSLSFLEDKAATEESKSLIASLLQMLDGLLNDYWWNRPYMGKVQIDLRTNVIREIE